MGKPNKKTNLTESINKTTQVSKNRKFNKLPIENLNLKMQNLEEICTDEDNRLVYAYKYLTKVLFLVQPVIENIYNKLVTRTTKIVEDEEVEVLVENAKSLPYKKIMDQIAEINGFAGEGMEALMESIPVAGTMKINHAIRREYDNDENENESVYKANKKSLKDVIGKARKLIRSTLNLIEEEENLDMRQYVYEQGKLGDYKSKDTNPFLSTAENPMIYGFEQMYALNVKDSPETGKSFQKSFDVLMGFSLPKNKYNSIEEFDKGQRMQKRVYVDFMNLKNAQLVQLGLDFEKRKLEKMGWPGASKEKYIQKLMEENRKIIDSFRSMKTVVDKYGQSRYDEYLDNPVAYITGETGATERELSKSVGYLAGQNYALMHGWTLEESGVLGLMGSIRYEIDRNKKLLDVKTACVERDNKDTKEEDIENIRQERAILNQFETEFKKIEKLAWPYGLGDESQDKRKLSCMKKKEIADGLIRFTNAFVKDKRNLHLNMVDIMQNMQESAGDDYEGMSENIPSEAHFGDEEDEKKASLGSINDVDDQDDRIEEIDTHEQKNEINEDRYSGVKRCMDFMVGSPSHLKKFSDVINKNAQAEYEYEQMKKNPTPDEFVYLAKVNGWPQFGPAKKVTNVFLKRFAEVLANIKKNQDVYDQSPNMQTDAQDLIQLGKQIMEKRLTSFDDVKDTVKKIRSVYKRNSLFYSINEEDRIFANKVYKKLKELDANDVQREAVLGVSDVRFRYLSVISRNMRNEDNNYMRHKNTNEYTNMVNAIDALLKMGPEDKIAPGLKRDYFDKKLAAVEAAKDYLKKTGLDTAYHKSGTRRRNGAILAIAMIEPALGESMIQKANRVRSLGDQINLYSLRKMEGVGAELSGGKIRPVAQEAPAEKMKQPEAKQIIA